MRTTVRIMLDRLILCEFYSREIHALSFAEDTPDTRRHAWNPASLSFALQIRFRSLSLSYSLYLPPHLLLAVCWRSCDVPPVLSVEPLRDIFGWVAVWRKNWAKNPPIMGPFPKQIWWILMLKRIKSVNKIKKKNYFLLKTWSTTYISSIDWTLCEHVIVC